MGWGGRLEGFFCCCCFPFFSGSRRGNKTARWGREIPGPRVVEGQHLQESLSAASLSVSDVVCWEKPRLQITHRHRPRAKVGGCGVRGAPAALISAGVHRRSPFVPAAPLLPRIGRRHKCRLTLISILAEKNTLQGFR